MASVFVGISGWDYPSWRGRFYPRDLPRTRWLAHAAAQLNSIELNGTFYSLKKPAMFAKWRDVAHASAPYASSQFVYAIKGGRFIMKKLRDCAQPLANFYASGVLALDDVTGPFLWQLPESLRFDADVLAQFFALLPRTSTDAAALARTHDKRLDGRALTTSTRAIAYRHALEPRHPSFFTRDAIAMLRSWDIGMVIADAAGRFPMAASVTAPFVYVRLHGSTQLYMSGYRDDELAQWAARVRGWRKRGLDVYVYFDNDGLGHAPFDALRLAAMVPSSSAPATFATSPFTRAPR